MIKFFLILFLSLVEEDIISAGIILAEHAPRDVGWALTRWP